MLRIPVNRCARNWTARTAFNNFSFIRVSWSTENKLLDAFNSSWLQHNDDKNDETLIFDWIKSFILRWSNNKTKWHPFSFFFKWESKLVRTITLSYKRCNIMIHDQFIFAAKMRKNQKMFIYIPNINFGYWIKTLSQGHKTREIIILKDLIPCRALIIANMKDTLSMPCMPISEHLSDIGNFSFMKG